MKHSRLIRKFVAIYVILPALLASNVQADDDEDIFAEETEPVTHYSQESTGLGAGAILGGILGGPPGLIVGAMGGIILGRNSGMQNELLSTRQELNDTRLALKQVSTSLDKTLETKRNKPNPPLMLASTNLHSSGLDSDVGKQITDIFEKSFILTVQFRTDSYVLEPHFQKQLEHISELLHNIDFLDIQLNGHTDPRGGDGYNLGLSRKRIEVVRSVLIKHGVSKNRIHTHAYGESDRLFKNTDNESMDFERRVLIRFINPGDKP